MGREVFPFFIMKALKMYLKLKQLEILMLFLKRHNRKKHLLKILVNKMLWKFGADYDYVIKHPDIEGKPWYTYYTWKNKDYEKWRKYSIKMIRRYFVHNKEMAEREFSWISLYYALHITDDDYNSKTKES